MIASIQGMVGASGADHLVVVANGIGYKVYVPVSALGRTTGEEVLLHTVLIIRENDVSLYGFLTLAERDLFERVISVSGIGPKTGLAVLSTLSAESLYNAVASGKPELLQRVPGIGKKTAEKMVFELKDKLKAGSGIIPTSAGGSADVNMDVIEALTALGYSTSEAQAAVAALGADAPKDFEGRMRAALGYFING
ncbi:MAG: Holliday junction branch migration protein RuvA [bacterium]|nr:Holliday junction branch migration protein RuvA [bacterium]